jgi:probable selenium-dependent hydroxylase accessory protein YqeC
MKITNVVPIRGGGVLSLVGGGGKTTTLLVLTEELRGLGKKVLITTTTKLSAKMPYRAELVLLEDEEHFISWLETNPGRFALLATDITNDGKLGGIPVAWLEKNHRLLACWDAILVEADGSQGKPIKANREYEPVIPANSSVVLVVIGLDVLGRPLTEEIAHRAELVGQLTGTGMGETVSPSTILELLKADHGLLKGTRAEQEVYLVLNKYSTVKDNQKDALVDALVDQLLDLDQDNVMAILITEMKDGKNPVKRVIACV